MAVDDDLRVTQTVAPSIEPLTMNDVKRQLRLDAANQEPAPDAVTVALAGDGAGNLDDAAYRYRCTFVTADGETEGGTISDAVTVVDKTSDGKVAVTGIPTGGSFVTARKLYRTEGDGSTYLLLATISDNETTTYTDNIADGSLGAECPSTNTTDDPQLLALVVAARQWVETFLHRQLISASWVLRLDAFPSDDNGLIELPFPPLQSVTSITYVDEDGDTQTLADTVYDAHTARLVGAVELAYDQTWPATRAQTDAVTITYVAGYGDARGDVPEVIRQAMLMLVSEWYEYRESFTTGAIVADVPHAVECLLGTHRVPVVV